MSQNSDYNLKLQEIAAELTKILKDEDVKVVIYKDTRTLTFANYVFKIPNPTDEDYINMFELIFSVFKKEKEKAMKARKKEEKQKIAIEKEQTIEEKTSRRKLVRKKAPVKTVISVALCIALGAFGTVKHQQIIEEKYLKEPIKQEVVQETTDDELGKEKLEEKPKYNFEELRNKYPDIVGYIEGDILPENYPVVKDSAKVGDAHYLYRTPEGETLDPSMGIGAISINEDNDFGLEDDFSLIWGHNTNGFGFDNLAKYDNAKMNKPLYYYNERGKFELQPVSYFIDDDFTFNLNYSDEEKQEKINEILNKSRVDYKTDVSVDDNFVIIYTCPDPFDIKSNVNSNNRYFAVFKTKELILYNTDEKSKSL